MSKFLYHLKSLPVAAVAVTTCVIAVPNGYGDLLFYEDFTGYTAGGASLNGQGGWTSSGDSQRLRNGTYNDGTTSWDGTIGNSATSGGNFLANGGTHAFGHIALAPSVTASFTGGSATWLSYVEYNGNNGSNGRQNAAIGAAPLTSNGGLEMAGQGMGVGTDAANTPKATFWQPNGIGDDKTVASSTIGSGRPIFIMAKIDWSDVGNDTLTVKRFAFNIPVALTEAGWNSESGFSTTSADLDQSTFDTLSFANQWAYLDEIRIASDFDSAVTGTVVVPEPHTLALTILGLLGLIGFRRRAGI